MCLSCGGVWLDGPEIAAVYPEVEAVLGMVEKNSGISQLDCPLCDEGMRSFAVESIKLDLCRRCSGLWIDGEELIGLEEARTRLANGDASPAGRGGYRNAPVTGPPPAATMLCPGCAREIERARMLETVDGPRCKLCLEVEREPLAPPLSFWGSLARALAKALEPSS